MGTGLVGEINLENGERVFITWLVRPLEESMRDRITKLRSMQIIDNKGNRVEKGGMLTFGTEPNPDAKDGTFVGMFLEVTRKNM